MKRDTQLLREEEFDLLVIGGGIYGATTARAATLRGLKVALIEAGDFGQATSANSLKIMHGGLRYLQHLDIKRMRESIKARRRLLQLAPHLVHPQAFVIPTYGHGLHGREIMAVGLALNDLMSWDRNRSVQPARHIPSGRVLSKKTICDILPGVSRKGLSGGALWYDCVAVNTERLTLSFVLAAAELGACIANYTAADSYLVEGGKITGLNATDRLKPEAFKIHARLVVDATGPFSKDMATSLPGEIPSTAPPAWAKAVNIVINRRLFGKHAVGLAGHDAHADPDAVLDKGDRFYFFVPWREGTLVGTSYKLHSGPPKGVGVHRRDVLEIIEEVNRAYPQAALTEKDVSFWHAGLLPCSAQGVTPANQPNLMKHEQILDYAEVGALQGLILVHGTKYTTAASVAERVADLALAKLGRSIPQSVPDPPLPGGEQPAGGAEAPHSSAPTSEVQNSLLCHLREQYGSRHQMILDHSNQDPELLAPLASGTNITAAEVIHSVREEMAQKLADVVLRRTELGTLGPPSELALAGCARVMAQELDWDCQRTEKETQEVKQLYDLPGE